MQERFCTCGKMVLVQYGTNDRMSRNPVFLTADKKIVAAIRLCPGCGMPLDINTLR
ncbi:hypothetical protein [Salidesulfovibrio onnuriiensis]|uniref:hypothetical protein n=1 Tax=Salidesulfovibrio onnuriiensis TaxID=2583823 RepID=UPI00164F392F|nr:hypothetical protein [Salidesulfovibrio onnuriiensis]